ncbi:MAG: sigma-54 dependent transcriptional regulator [Polyangiaceae bacterium]|jgi:two-component system response regulator HydG
MQSRILIVDDDLEMREALEGLFSAEGYACEAVPDAPSALSLVSQQTFDAVVSDVRMEGMDGLELLDSLNVSHPALPVVLLTGKGGIDQAIDAIKRGAFGYAVKPCKAGELEKVVAQALEARRHPDSVRAVRPVAKVELTEEGELVGAGPAMKVLQTAIDFVARSCAPVLVTGETGVGKELVARAIHARSARADRPFVAVNTSAIPTEMLEGEIFGHVRGGFTGAIQARKGLLTEADGGTLLLDEIGDMSFGLQAKLLRVLQFGDVRPVGSDRVHHVDVRVIASTHRDLPRLVKEGRFREDLHFRLDVLSVHVPPLRDRREDIPALAAHFLAQARKRAPQSPVCSIGRDALQVLASRAWPGNVRELASAIERAVVFGVDEMIDANQLSAPAAANVSTWPFPTGSPWTLQQLTRTYAEWVLAQNGGDKQRAAEIMGIDLSTLYRWRRKDP